MITHSLNLNADELYCRGYADEQLSGCWARESILQGLDAGDYTGNREESSWCPPSILFFSHRIEIRCRGCPMSWSREPFYPISKTQKPRTFDRRYPSYKSRISLHYRRWDPLQLSKHGDHTPPSFLSSWMSQSSDQYRHPLQFLSLLHLYQAVFGRL